MRRFAGLATGLFTAVTACGDDGVHHLADAPQFVDAPAGDAAQVTTITVTTLARVNSNAAPDAPIANVNVVVLNPDLTMGPSAMTGADGKATLGPVLPGSTVTAYYPADATTDHWIVTMVGVKPGANLTFGEHYFQRITAATAPASVTVNIPAIDTATSYQVSAPCNNYLNITAPATSGTFQFGTDCDSATKPMSFQAYGPSGMLGTAYLPAAATTDGATVTLPAWNPYPTAANFTTSVSGVPDDHTINGLTTYTVYSKVGDQRLTMSSSTGIPTLTAGAGSFANTLPLDGLRSMAALYYAKTNDTNGVFKAMKSYKAVAGAGTSVALDAPKLPFISYNLDYTTDPKKVTWTSTAGTGDALVGRLSWQIDDMVDGPGTGPFHNYYWNVIGPYTGQTEVSWATWPAALADQLPPATGVGGGVVQVVDLANVSSYDQVLATPEWQLVTPNFAVSDGDLTAADVADGGEGNPTFKRGPSARTNAAPAKRAAPARLKSSAKPSRANPR